MQSSFRLFQGARKFGGDFYRKHAPASVKDPTSPDHWREKVLYAFVLITLPVGLFVFIAGMPVNIAKGYWLVSSAAIIGYLACLLVFFNPRIPYRIRAVTACLVIYLLGVALILDVGPFLGTREYLFVFSILASLLLGWSGAAVAITINLLTCLSISWMVHVGFWPQVAGIVNPLREWHMIAVDLIFINISTTVLITLFFKRIELSDFETKKYSQLLFKERETLAEANKKLETEIEERQMIGLALIASEEKYRTILETIKDAYFEVDLKGTLTFFNNALCQKLGYRRDELKGLNFRALLAEPYADEVVSAFRKIRAGTLTEDAIDIPVATRQNGVVTLSILAQLMTNKVGEPVGFQGIARDITEQRALETRLRRAEKMEAVGALAGGVAHDLNNTLFGVVGYPELMLMNMKETDPLRKSLLEIKKSGEKAVAIVQDMLTLARRGIPVREVVNLNTLIEEYLTSNEFHKMKSYHPGVKVTKNLDASLFNVVGSPVHLSKAIMNLIANAAEAIEAQGEICISTHNLYVEPSVGQEEAVAEGDYAVVTIRDTGEGIEPEDLDRIFEPFFTKKKMGHSGTGLGMAVVWGTISDHDGQITVKSIRGRGTTFTIYLPITRDAIAQPASALPMAQYLGQGETILVVDDVAVQREVACAMLAKLGYQVAAVESGEKAVEYLQNHAADLIVLDMIMRPGIDGLETYRQILEISPKQKAIIASGFSETEQVREAQKLGAGAYLRKPYSIERLGLTIKEEIRKSF